jgi:hypothetical protein
MDKDTAVPNELMLYCIKNCRTGFYWSNVSGWGRVAEMTLFPHTEKVRYESLPLDGKWHSISSFNAMIKLKEYEDMLNTLREDAFEALNGNWDRDDEGFAAQIESIDHALGRYKALLEDMDDGEEDGTIPGHLAT